MRLTAPASILAAFAFISSAAAEPDRDASSLSTTSNSLDATLPPETTPAPPPPPAKAKPGASLTNKKGGVVLQLNAEMNMTTDKAFKPVSLAPDLSYGVTDKLTLAIVHSSFALTGFRGSAGSGLCIVSKENGCPSVYRQGGFEIRYGVASGPTAVEIDLGLIAKDLRPASKETLDAVAKLGAKARFSAGKFSLLMSPNLWIGLSNRTINDANSNPAKVNKDQLWFPVVGWVKPIPALMLGVGSGIKGQLSKFADNYSIPVGALAQVMVNKHLQIGTSFIFGAITAGKSVTPDGTDARALQVWLTLST